MSARENDARPGRRCAAVIAFEFDISQAGDRLSALAATVASEPPFFGSAPLGLRRVAVEGASPAASIVRGVSATHRVAERS